MQNLVFSFILKTRIFWTSPEDKDILSIHEKIIISSIDRPTEHIGKTEYINGYRGIFFKENIAVILSYDAS